jgi:hypothetical protein
MARTQATRQPRPSDVIKKLSEQDGPDFVRLPTSMHVGGPIRRTGRDPPVPHRLSKRCVYVAAGVALSEKIARIYPLQSIPLERRGHGSSMKRMIVTVGDNPVRGLDGPQ